MALITSYFPARIRRKKLKGNLITYFNNIYRLGIPEQVGTNGIALLFGILHKANQLKYPKKMKISNTELCYLTGSGYTTIWRIRQKLLEYRYNNDPNYWIIKYTPLDNKHSGFYELNYFLLNYFQNEINNESNNESNNETDIEINNEINQNQFQNEINLVVKNEKSLQNQFQNEMDPIQYNNNNISTSSCTSTNITYKEEDVDKIENEEKKEKDANAIKEEKEEKEFQKTKIAIQTICPTFRIANATMGNAVREISQYPEDKRKAVFQNAGLKGLKVGDVLKYLKNGLENYDEYYNGNGKKPIEQQVVHKEIEPFLSDEDRESLEKEARAREKRLQAEWRKKQGIKEKAAISESEAQYNGAKSDESVMDEDFPPEVKEKINQAMELQAKRRS
uniref:Uncharacterized protein n=2 Tax=viral metagenome TaxID=1070528 RepID=A0A6M3IHC3_9ZZZZ